jgi:hypothetical protein
MFCKLYIDLQVWFQRMGKETGNATFQGLTTFGNECVSVPSLCWHMTEGRYTPFRAVVKRIPNWSKSSPPLVLLWRLPRTGGVITQSDNESF